MARTTLSEDERASRRRVVLEAAHRLYRERGALPSVAEIAAAAGVAKGSVYLYFRTKEEIFVALLEDGFKGLFFALDPLLDGLPPGGPGVPQAFASGYGALVAGSGDLLPLAATANAILEQNLPVEPMERFKTVLAEGIRTAGLRLEARTGLAPAGSGETLLLHTYALSLGLWQALAYPPALKALLQLPALRSLDRDFGAELHQAVAALWRGYFA